MGEKEKVEKNTADEKKRGKKRGKGKRAVGLLTRFYEKWRSSLGKKKREMDIRKRKKKKRKKNTHERRMRAVWGCVLAEEIVERGGQGPRKGAPGIQKRTLHILFAIEKKGIQAGGGKRRSGGGVTPGGAEMITGVQLKSGITSTETSRANQVDFQNRFWGLF